MKSPVKRLSIIIGVVLLPLLLYTFFEVSTLNENEQMLSEIYNQQLDGVALGINQYSEGIMKNWAIESKRFVNELDIEKRSNGLINLIKSQSALELLVLIDTNNFANMEFYSAFGRQSSKTAAMRMKNVLLFNAKKIEQLKVYYSTGYDKIERIENNIDTSPLYAFLSANSKLVVFAIDDQKFVESLLDKKIAPIKRGEFNVSINKRDKLQSDKLAGVFDESQKIYDLWLLPDYYLGISFNGQTIEDFVGERSILNIALIVLLNLVVIFGLIYVFMNAKKEIELSQMKTDFVANVSHEIRTPLSLISMFAETLELGRVKKEDKKQEYYTIIRKESERLSNIVNKILNFSQMEAQKKKFTFAPTDLNDIIKEIMSTYQFHFMEKKVDFRVSYFEDLPIISIDRGAVSEAVINVIDNAVKYSGDDKRVAISTYLNSKNNVVVEVEDNGIGIAKENLDKVFEKFFRSSSTLVHDTKGNGLGLTLVKHIMQVHDGDVTVESKLGKGSKFRLEFPVTT